MPTKQRPIHVCHVLYGLGAGGLENGVINVVTNLQPPEFRHSLCLLSGSGVFSSRLPAGTDIFELGKTEDRGRFLATALAKIFRQHKVDIVHSRNWGTFFDAVLGGRLARVPVCIHSIHGIYFDDLKHMKQRRRVIQRWLSLLTTRMFAVSDSLRDYYVTVVGVRPTKIQTIRNGVSLDRFERSTQKPASILSELGIETGETVIGWVGTLYWVKNPDMFVRAAIRFKEEPAVKFLVVGGGELLETLRQESVRVGMQDRMVFTGHRDDVSHLMKVMDVFVQTSVTEGMSNTILEAMASSLPCVVTNVGGNGELVTPGENGFLVPSGDAGQLADRLVDLVRDPMLRQQMGERSRERVQREYTIRRMTDEYRTLYLDCYRGKS
jgi:sugar transferase (PEP-CTERM/EpsH1 system associated)